MSEPPLRSLKSFSTIQGLGFWNQCGPSCLSDLVIIFIFGKCRPFVSWTSQCFWSTNRHWIVDLDKNSWPDYLDEIQETDQNTFELLSQTNMDTVRWTVRFVYYRRNRSKMLLGLVRSIHRSKEILTNWQIVPYIGKKIRSKSILSI